MILTVSVLLVLGSVSPVLALAPGVDEAPWGAWVTRTVDDRSVGTTSVGLVLDASQTPHMVYGATGPGGWGAIYYAQQTGISWSTELITEATGHGDQATIPGDLALDETGTPHVVYRGAFGPNALYHAQRAPGGWTETVLDATSSGNPRMAADTDGRMHVAYEANNDGTPEVRYTTNAAGAWVTDTVEIQNTFWLDIAVGPNDQPHIAYWAGPGSDAIRYATKDTQGDWVIEEHTGCVGDVSIAVDPARGVHISCKDPDGLVYLYRDPSTSQWSRELVSDGSNLVPPRSPTATGLSTSIALDSQLRPHISFTVRPTGFSDDPLGPVQQHYAAKVDGAWRVETVDRDGFFNGWLSSIAIDDEDRPHIASVVLMRFARGSCSDAWNACTDLRYAVPASAAPSSLLAG